MPPLRSVARFIASLLLAALLLATSMLPAHAAPLYQLVDLGDLGGPSGSLPRDINNAGEVVGISQSNDTNPWRAVRWDADGSIHDLNIVSGPPSSTVYSFANGINDSGQIAGYIDREFGNPSYFTKDVFRWTNGGGTQNLSFGIATAINSGGTVVGYGDIPGPPQQIAQLWAPPNFGNTVLGTLPAHDRSAALDINSSSQVVGSSFTRSGDSTMSRAFLWLAADGMQDLGALPGHAYSAAAAINDAGQVVGHSTNDSSGLNSNKVAFRWTLDGGMIPLAPGAQFATDINSSGQIVGMGELGPFLWTSADGLLSLASLLDSSGVGWNLTSAVAINDFGQIVVSGTGAGVKNHALLLTPVPEPATGMTVVVLVLCSVCATCRNVATHTTPRE